MPKDAVVYLRRCSRANTGRQLTATTSGTATAQSRRPERPQWTRTGLAPLVAGALVVVAVIAGFSALSRIRILLEWNDTFSGVGTFTVVACESEGGFGPDQWRCEGRLTTSAAADLGAELIVGKDARLSSRPYVGQQVEVYYVPPGVDGGAGPEVVYALNTQLAELTRLYLILPPLMMIMIGAAGAVLGLVVEWLVARSPDADSRWRTSPRFPDLRRRGTIWLIVGSAVLMLHQLVVHYVTGSAGVA